MRYIIVLVFFLSPDLLKPQTYSQVISDDEIIAFINQDIQRDSVKGIRSINREMFKLFEDVFYFKDSADYYHKNQNISTFIFRKHIFRGRVVTDYLDTIFTRQDIDYFLLQINGLKEKESWKNNFINSRFFDYVKFDSTSRGELRHLDRFKSRSNNNQESVIYTYSLPIFSFDKRKAIIIKGFNCGLVCGGGGYYIYEKTNNNGWKLIGEINTWAE